MNIIHNDAEEQLVGMLEMINAGKVSMHCIHIKCAVFKPRDLEELPAFFKTWLGHQPEGCILICEDQDVFIFAPHLPDKLFMEFKNIFFGHLTYLPRLDADMMSLHDKNTDWIDLLGKARTKLLESKKRRLHTA